MPKRSLKRPLYLAIIFGIYALVTVSDIWMDWGEASPFHLSIEVAILALTLSIAWMFANRYQNTLVENQILAQTIIEGQQNQVELQKQKELWMADSQKWKAGISQSIDRQLEVWKFSKSEKEVALLLLKGLSVREIAEARSTAEKTVRAQALAIYQKSKLGGRAELSAFFLEDVLVIPQ